MYVERYTTDLVNRSDGRDGMIIPRGWNEAERERGLGPFNYGLELFMPIICLYKFNPFLDFPRLPTYLHTHTGRRIDLVPNYRFNSTQSPNLITTSSQPVNKCRLHNTRRFPI